MFELGLAYAIQVEREREIEAAIRRRRLLQPQGEATESVAKKRPNETRTFVVRTRATGG